MPPLAVANIATPLACPGCQNPKVANLIFPPLNAGGQSGREEMMKGERREKDAKTGVGAS